MREESAERKSGDHSKKISNIDKGKGILMYQRKKSRKDVQKNIEVAMGDLWSSRKNKGICIRDEQHEPPLPPPAAAAAAAEPPKEKTTTAATNGVCFPRKKVSQAKVYPSVIVPPSKENRREIISVLPNKKLEDISVIELLASGDDLGGHVASSQPSISFMDMLQNNDNNLGKKVGVESTTLRLSNLQNNGLAAWESLLLQEEPKSKNNNKNYFMKMLMDEEGVDEEQLFMEVKQELMIREVDAYASLLRKQNLDFGKLIPRTP